jgi:hypothetical protein
MIIGCLLSPQNALRERDDMTTPEVMTPESPRWDQFCGALDEALGQLGCGGDNARPTHEVTKRVLTRMGHVDVGASIDFYEQHGGYCDCEVMLNVVMKFG